MIWLFLVIGLIVIIVLTRKFKKPKISCMALVTGGVKAGKSTFSCALALSKYKSQVRKVRFANFFRRIFRKELFEKPLLYSNVPLNCEYVPLTDDLLLRKQRFVYRSVIYAQEASLIADSQLIKDLDINQRLLLFNKLIGHETKGGYLIYDTQCINDNHYSVKRCISEYFYIHDTVKWIPFILLCHVRELRYSDDGQEINVYEGDVEESMRTVLISKRTWKMFDSYCYSVLTDHLPVASDVVEGRELSDLKARKIVSFRKYKNGGAADVERNNKK